MQSETFTCWVTHSLRIEGYKSGHALNNRLLSALVADESAWEMVTYDEPAQVPIIFMPPIPVAEDSEAVLGLSLAAPWAPLPRQRYLLHSGGGAVAPGDNRPGCSRYYPPDVPDSRVERRRSTAPVVRRNPFGCVAWVLARLR